jgi:hypothetical protein
MGVHIKGVNYVPGLDLHVVSYLVEGMESLCRSEVLIVGCNGVLFISLCDGALDVDSHP